jgi:NAD(P)-dependent dehydrogenase (short-subunit alcohol dehydrogenase family)
MVMQNSGNIINLSSEVGLTPGLGGGAYSVSKAGIIMLTRQMALELARYNIRVNALAPGIVKTDFNTQFWKAPEVEKKSAEMCLWTSANRRIDPLSFASECRRYIRGKLEVTAGGSG